MKISYFNNENMSVSNTIKAGPLRGKRIKTRLLPTQGLFQHDYLSNEEAFILLGNTLYYYLSDINEGKLMNLMKLVIVQPLFYLVKEKPFLKRLQVFLKEI